MRGRRGGPAAAVRAALGSGAFHGSVLYGGTVCLLHVAHNREVLTSPWNALVLLGASLLLYGLWAAVTFAVVAWGVWAVRSRLKRRGPGSSGPEVAAGAWVFTFGFWAVVATYGLTYDEAAPFGWPAPAGPVAMLGYMGLRIFAVAVGATAVAWLWVRLCRASRSPKLGLRRRRALLAGPYVLLLVAVPVVTVLGGATARPAEAKPSPAGLPEPRELREPVPVVLVALDGADWRVIGPLLEAGELPNLARLVEGGVHGPLETLPGTNSAVLWASIYSGLEPREHGVLDFYTVRLAGMTAGVYPVHRTYFKELAGGLEAMGLAERVTVDRSALGAPLLWEIAAALGRSVGVVDGYYYSYPAPTLPGDQGYFLAYGTDRFYRRVSRGRRPPSTAPGASEYARPPELLDELGELLAGWELDWQSRSLLQLLADRPQPDLVSLYAHQPDAVQHWYWRAWQPELYPWVDPAEIAAHGDAIPELHREADRFLGELLERLDPGTVVIVASDHGHSPTLFHAMDTQHRHGPPGILIVAGGPVREGGRIEGAHVYDLFPTVLHLLGLPVPETAAGRVLEEALEPGFRREVRRVASYEALLPAFLPQDRRRGESDERRRREELEKLRALGYVH